MPFEFSDEPATHFAGDSHFVGAVGEVRGKDALLEALFWGLEFPGYFGFNWDALWDCLCDFTWLEADTVVLVHSSVPELSESELRIYVQLLAEAIEDWKSRADSRSFQVVFPEAAREVIASALKS